MDLPLAAIYTSQLEFSSLTDPKKLSGNQDDYEGVSGLN